MSLLQRDTIVGLRARPVFVPFRRPPLSASGAIAGAALVLIDLETSSGVVGRSYVFGFAKWTLRPIVECLKALEAMILGEVCAPLALEAKMRQQVKLLDTPGLLGIALSGVDMAAWDALARGYGVPLVEALGASVRPIDAYNSCGLWLSPIDTLADEAQELLAEGGFQALKLRLGRGDARDDLVAIRRVKERIGPDVALMTDYNQCLTLAQAVQRARMLDEEGVYWIEEPLRHSDYEGYAQLCASIHTPIQAGENLTSTHEMQRALALRSFDYVMPDLQRIGGVSGWLRACALAEVHGVALSSHLFPEFSAHVLAASPTRHYLEYVDWAAPILQEPYEVRDGRVQIPARPGAGIDWNEHAVERYLI